MLHSTIVNALYFSIKIAEPLNVVSKSTGLSVLWQCVLIISCIAESEEDMELANTSGSMLEISDNFAKKEKKSGSFVR